MTKKIFNTLKSLYTLSSKTWAVFCAVILIFSAIIFINCLEVSAKNISSPKQTETLKKDQKSTAETLSLIDKYQKKYFVIIKRNDLFLNTENNNAVNKDQKELKKLYKEVKGQIKNKDYLKKYKEIEKRYSKCEEITTTGIVEHANKHYKEVNDLLNEVYKEVKSKISSEDFKKLADSEKKWLKETENYDKVLDSMEFGTLRSIIYYDYQIDMRNFRTLLLMLYL